MTTRPLGSLARLVAAVLTLTGFAYGEASVNEAPLPVESGSEAREVFTPPDIAKAKVVVRFVEFKGALPSSLTDPFATKHGTLPTERGAVLRKMIEDVQIATVGAPQVVDLSTLQGLRVESSGAIYPASKLVAAIGGTELRLHPRSVGLAVKLNLLDARNGDVSVEGTAEHTSTDGFVQHGETLSPIYATTEGEKIPMALKVGQTAFLRFEWFKPRAWMGVSNGRRVYTEEEDKTPTETWLVFIGLDEAD